MNNNLSFFKQYWRELAIGILLVLIVISCVWHRETVHEAEKAKILTAAQMKDTNSIQNELDTTKSNAQQIKDYYEKAQTGQVKPTSQFSVQAPNSAVATKNVTERINTQDTSLPPSALQKTDRTVVVEQPQNKEYQVGVYKIDLEKSHKIDAGVTFIDSKVYLDLGYRQDQNQVIIHYSPATTKYGVTYTRTISQW